MILNTGVFNISVLAEDTSFDTFKRFGFASGKDTDKFEGFLENTARSANGLLYVTAGTNAFMSAKVIEAHDYGQPYLICGRAYRGRSLKRRAVGDLRLLFRAYQTEAST